MSDATVIIMCDWTAVHDALEGFATSVKVYGACTCQSPGFTLSLIREGDLSDTSPHLRMTLVVDLPTEEMPDLMTPCGVEYEEVREVAVERVTIGGAADVTIDVMHPRDI